MTYAGYEFDPEAPCPMHDYTGEARHTAPVNLRGKDYEQHMMGDQENCPCCRKTCRWCLTDFAEAQQDPSMICPQVPGMYRQVSIAILPNCNRIGSLNFIDYR